MQLVSFVLQVLSKIQVNTKAQNSPEYAGHSESSGWGRLHPAWTLPALRE